MPREAVLALWRRRSMTDAPTCNAKQLAGLALLKENKIDFEDVHTTLGKIVGNVVNAPEEPKYKRLKTTNAKIKALCSTPGARQLLVGSGFVEEEEALALPADADIAPMQAALQALTAQQAARKEEDEAAKAEAVKEQRAKALAARKAAEPKGPQVKASHILLKPTADKPIEAQEKRIADWKALLDDHPHHLMQNKFVELAKAHSDCPSGAKGGALGFFAKGKMVDEFDAVAFTAKIGSVQGPVRSEHGVHLIWVQSRIAGK